MNDVMKTNGFNIQPQSLDEAWRVCQALAKSDMVPKDYKGKPENVLVAAQMGAELGLKPLQALQNIAVVNGRPSVWGDALLAIVRGHPECDDVQETIEGSGDSMVASCTVRRRGQTPTVATFSVADAKAAGLWKKQGPWTQYPKRMLQLRARAFALRDAFADALRGIQVAEEVQDIRDGGIAEVVEKPSNSATQALLEKHAAPAAAVEEPEAEAPKGPTAAELREQIAEAETVIDIRAVGKRIKAADYLTEDELADLREMYQPSLWMLTVQGAATSEEVYDSVQKAQAALSDEQMKLVNGVAAARLKDLEQADAANA